jgi:hypothetical protein
MVLPDKQSSIIVSHLSATVIASLSESLMRKKQCLPPGADHKKPLPPNLTLETATQTETATVGYQPVE